MCLHLNTSTSRKGAFLERYLRGDACAEEIDDAVDAWHANPGGKALHTHLGMSEAEYQRWVRKPDALAEIAQTRRAKSSRAPFK
jgi:hypothetical protein